MPKFLKPAPAHGGTLVGQHISAGLGRRILRHAIPPLCSVQVCAVRPNLSPPDQARSRPAPRHPAHPQAASNVGNSLRSGHGWCPKCQVTGQRHRTGASSGADFGFWRLSAREKRRRLGRFPDRRRFMGAKISQLSRRSGRWRGDSRAVGRSDADMPISTERRGRRAYAAPFLPQF